MKRWLLMTYPVVWTLLSSCCCEHDRATHVDIIDACMGIVISKFLKPPRMNIELASTAQILWLCSSPIGHACASLMLVPCKVAYLPQRPLGALGFGNAFKGCILDALWSAWAFCSIQALSQCMHNAQVHHDALITSGNWELIKLMVSWIKKMLTLTDADV